MSKSITNTYEMCGFFCNFATQNRNRRQQLPVSAKTINPKYNSYE